MVAKNQTGGGQQAVSYSSIAVTSSPSLHKGPSVAGRGVGWSHRPHRELTVISKRSPRPSTTVAGGSVACQFALPPDTESQILSMSSSHFPTVIFPVLPQLYSPILQFPNDNCDSNIVETICFHCPRTSRENKYVAGIHMPDATV